MHARKLYGQYMAKVHALAASELPEDRYRQAVLELARQLDDDLATLRREDRRALCDDLGVQLEHELHRATSDRQRRVFVALLKIVDR